MQQIDFCNTSRSTQVVKTTPRQCPTTARQLDLANLLVDELGELGLQEITLEESGIVMATLPANVQHKRTGDWFYCAYGYHPGHARQVHEPAHH